MINGRGLICGSPDIFVKLLREDIGANFPSMYWPTLKPEAIAQRYCKFEIKLLVMWRELVKLR